MNAGQQGYISSTNRCPIVSYLNVITLYKLTKINSSNRALKTARLVKPTVSGKLFHTLTNYNQNKITLTLLLLDL